MTQFASPGSPSGGIDMNEVNGSLLLVKVLGIEDGIETVHGTRSAARADVTVLDGPSAGTQYEDSMLWGKVMVGQLRNRIGELVLGRVAKGQANKGQNAPWILEAATEADVRTAQQWLEKQHKPSVSSAEPPF